jgi:hypothetical protein
MWNYMNQVAQSFYNGSTATVGRSGVHVVGASSNYINLGHYIGYGNGVTKVGANLIATRIA